VAALLAVSQETLGRWEGDQRPLDIERARRWNVALQKVAHAREEMLARYGLRVADLRQGDRWLACLDGDDLQGVPVAAVEEGKGTP
jgi:hypothetical protein